MLMSWLQRRWQKVCLWAAAVLFAAWAISFLFGLTSEVCSQAVGSNDAHCPRYNLVFAIIWDFFKILDAGSALITALATAVLTYVTYLLVELGKKQFDTADRQLAISGQQADIQLKQQQIERMQFLATHRPKLRIRRIDHIVLAVGQQITAQIEVANIGASEAIIVQLGASVFFRDPTNPNAAQFSAIPADVTVPPIPAGKVALVSIRSGQVTTAPDIAAFQARTNELCALGILNYNDPMGVQRSTSFFRIFNHAGNRFVAAPDDPSQGDREYED